MSGVITLGLGMTTGTPALADVTAVQGDATALSIGGSPLGSQVNGQATAPQQGYGPIGSGDLPSGIDCGTGLLPTLPGLPGGVLLSLGLLEACTRGGNVGTHQGFAESQSRVVDLQLGSSDLGVITSACVATGDGATGNTQILGSPVLPENPTPGQVVPVELIPPILGIGGLTVNVTLNEQVSTNVPGTADITVTALHVNLLGIDIVVGRSHCRATGPDVNVPTTGATTPTTVGTTTTTGGTTGGGGGTTNNNNNNNNSNGNNNTSENTNDNTTENTNSNTNSNSQDQTNSQTQTGGNNSNTNSNVITITNLATNFDAFHHRGHFSNDDGHKGEAHFGKALARTGASSGRLTGLALLLLVFGGLLVLASRRVTTDGPAVPAVGRRPRRWR